MMYKGEMMISLETVDAFNYFWNNVDFDNFDVQEFGEILNNACEEFCVADYTEIEYLVTKLFKEKGISDADREEVLEYIRV